MRLVFLRNKDAFVIISPIMCIYTFLGKKYYLFSAIDCKSRYGFIHCYKTISSASGRDFIGKVKAYFPFPIKAINTDNGSEYLGQFHQETSALKIPHFFTDPNCPKQNGRVERFHQTAEYEYFNYQDDLLDDLSMINQHCQEFNFKYNYSRYHQALGYQRPADYVRKLLTRSVTECGCPGCNTTSQFSKKTTSKLSSLNL